jgi:hypothetical protein
VGITSTALKSHSKTHAEPTLFCPEPGCTYSAWHKNSMLQHKIRHHDRPPPPPPPPGAPRARYECNLAGCTFSCNNKTFITRHQEKMHDPAQGNALACRQCGFITDNHVTLLGHIRGHNGKKRNGGGAGGVAVASAYAAAATAAAAEAAAAAAAPQGQL